MIDFAPAFEQIASFHALLRAARNAARGKRRSRAAAGFLWDVEHHVLELERELLSGEYRPRPYSSFVISKPKRRTISAAHFRDRVVHHALCAALEPGLERCASSDSYACRRGKGILSAVRRARRLARGSEYALRLDIARFYERIDHRRLLHALASMIGDPRVLALCEIFVRAGAPGSAPGLGLPIGNLTSQHFANFYLAPLDRFIAGRSAGYVRYMDDMVVFGSSKRSLWSLERAVDVWVVERLALQLKPSATRVLPVSEGVPFLGFRVWPRLIRFGPNEARRFRTRMRRLDRGLERGELDEDEAARRASGLVGWARHGDTLGLRRKLIERR